MFNAWLCSLYVRQRWGGFKEAHLWKPGTIILAKRSYFLFLEHEVSLPVGDIKVELPSAQLQNQLNKSTRKIAVTHSKTTHLSFFSHFPSWEMHSLSAFFFILHVVCSLWEQHSPFYWHLISFLIFSSLFLWDCHFYTPFTNVFLPLCFICCSLFCWSDILSESSVT